MKRWSEGKDGGSQAYRAEGCCWWTVVVCVNVWVIAVKGIWSEIAFFCCFFRCDLLRRFCCFRFD